MKKLFGGIDLTWKNLILFAVGVGFYTALMAIIPITKDTSFRDIAIQLEWWILFGVIIICNSKSPTDSALKCFLFFLISQPLIYLLQVPFSHMGWKLFGYYRYWFIWTLFTIPMGFIGYYIKKKSIVSLIILLPILIFLALLGLGYFNSFMEDFPHHLLSCIFCFSTIIIFVFYLFDKLKLRLLAFGMILFIVVFYSFIRGGFLGSEFEVVKSLDQYNLKGDLIISHFSGTKKGKANLIAVDDSYHVKLNGRRGGKYQFTITDEEEVAYNFEYYYEDKRKTVVLKEKK